jgi:2-phospho-L-lactate guanylyltransferase
MDDAVDLIWTLVIPLKDLARAKSRLAAATGGYRSDLALAFAVDTVTAAMGSANVETIVVVTDDPIATSSLAALGAVIVPDGPAAGLNPAIAHGASYARALTPGNAVAALFADLPALRTTELDQTLTAAARHPAAFVADAEGTGTTLYAARRETPFTPRFGPGSRQRHLATGATELTLGVPSVRRDVDTITDLRAALELGVGPRTAALLKTAQLT